MGLEKLQVVEGEILAAASQKSIVVSEGLGRQLEGGEPAGLAPQSGSRHG
jgi:hypothetical protein